MSMEKQTSGEKPISGQCLDENLLGKMMSHVNVVANHLTAMQNYCTGYAKYLNEFMLPFLISTNYFSRVEQDKLHQNKLFKQMIDFQKTTFDNSFNALTTLQEQGDKMVNAFIEQAVFLPEEGKAAVKKWVDAYREGRIQYKEAVDQNFKKVEDFFSEAE